MNMKNLKPRSGSASDGFSLLELMVSLTVMLIVAGSTLSVLSYSQKLFVSQQMQADMHAGLRGAFELLTQEIGQAGALNFQAQTLSAAVTSSSSAQTVSISSSANMFVGEQLTVGTGSSQETVTVTAIPGATQVTGIFQKNHATASPIVARGIFPQGVLSSSSSTSLKMFGDINGNGTLTYVQYDCDMTAGTLSRSITTIAPGVTTRSASQTLLTDMITNPGGTPCFQYGAAVSAGGYSFIPSVAVSLTLQTARQDAQTGAYVTMTKSFSNLSSRNILTGITLAQAGVTNRLQPTPPGIPLGP